MKKFLNALGIIFLFILIFGIIGKSLNFEVSDEKDDPNSDDPIVNPGDIVGPGNSGSGSTTLNSYIIEVDELPKENIDENAIYKIKEEFKDVLIVYDGEISYLSEAFQYKFKIEDEKPSENIYESDLSNKTYLYYILSENNLFLYCNIGAGLNWYTLSDLFAMLKQVNLSFGGKINDIYDNLENGFYLYYDEGEEYIYKNERFYLNRSFEEVFSELISGEKFNYFEFDNYYDGFYSDIFASSNVDYVKINNHKNLNPFSLGDSLFSYSTVRVLHLTHSDRNIPFEMTFSNTFTNANYLESIILDFGAFEPFDSVLDDSNITDGICFIYVPDDLVESVKNMNGWKNIAEQIKPISEFKG